MGDRGFAFDVPKTQNDNNSLENYHLGNKKTTGNGSARDDATDDGSDKTEKNPGVLDLIKNFGGTTSMHGLPHALGDGTIWRRLFWTALVIGFAVWATYNVIEIIKDYQSRPVLTTVTSAFQSKMPFPAVTFCNLNRVRKSQASPELLEDVEANLVLGGVDYVENTLDQAVRATNPGDQMRLGHQLDNMLVSCYFGLPVTTVLAMTKKLSFSDHRKNTGRDYSLTWTKDHGRLPLVAGAELWLGRGCAWTTVKPGPKNGLRLDLNIEANEYLSSSSVGGIKVLIHDKLEYPFPEDGGLIVGPGFYTSIGIRKTNITRLSQPYGDCIENGLVSSKNLFSDEGYGYSRNACQKSCFQEYVYRNCSCCESSYPCVSHALVRSTGKAAPSTGIPFCNISRWVELDCVDRAQLKFQENLLGCVDACPAACTQSTFATSISTGMFPMELSINATVEKLKRSGTVANVTDFNQFLRQSFLQLEIFYESFILEKVDSEPAYTWNKLLGDIGGQVGLLLGFSILTAVELLELLVVDIGVGLGFASLCRGRKGKAVAHGGE
ncbi:hypothetical protein EGW08_010284 [Elysia chlorotica]|uniref:Uncharacterized protein n=1 Tax=Elysia chlorotica TaxID=188477 RepID=A0A433TK15_ELYCH|nr:hypothetical protein EGW08_010284 [Elysia chlorotica]